MNSFRPCLTYSLFVLPAILISLGSASFHDALLHDHDAIRQGQLWRIWTGHWVHFSNSHLAWNLIAIALTGPWLEALKPGWLLRYTLGAAPLISVGLFLVQPDMIHYGGLSGLGTGIVTLLGLALLKSYPPDRWLGLAALALVSGKLIFDATHAAPLLSDFDSATVISAPLAHLAGFGIAAVFWLAFEKPHQSHLHSPSSCQPALDAVSH